MVSIVFVANCAINSGFFRNQQYVFFPSVQEKGFESRREEEKNVGFVHRKK